MRSVTSDTVTQTFVDLMAPDTSPRLRFVLERLAAHLHDFARETELTHEEWRTGIELLTKAAKITTPERNEFVLFSDVLGLSSLVDMIHSPQDATNSSVLGPFHITGAPDLPVGGDLKGDNDGDTVLVEGFVKNRAGEPIEGAALEIWQTADNGLYSNQDAAQPDYNLRARQVTGPDGRYAFTTIRPAPYTVPDDGPVGTLLHATGRHPWRPSHLHFIVEAAGYRTLVTEVFPDDDAYLDADAVFGVREDLIMQYQMRTDASTIAPDIAARDRMSNPYYVVDFDFILAEAPE